LQFSRRFELRFAGRIVFGMDNVGLSKQATVSEGRRDKNGKPQSQGAIPKRHPIPVSAFAGVP
jgi:hypothetical protein